MVRNLSLALLAGMVLSVPTQAREAIRLPNNPSLSPDGKTIAFDWSGDIWVVPASGGVARPLTANPAKDSSPKFSPDGKEIAFISAREGSPQVFVMPATGGSPQQITFHTSGYELYEWTPDGTGFVVGTRRDDGWGRGNGDRIQIVRRSDAGAPRKADEMLFDDYGQNGTLSADGKTVLFNREGPAWWRKGYTGSQSAQLWSYDRQAKKFARLNTGEWDARWAMWGKGNKAYYTSGQGGCFNIWELDLGTNKARQVTKFAEDSTVFPGISRDGSTIVFRSLFDLYTIQPGSNETPKKVEIFRDDDRPSERVERRTLTSARAVAFTADGLEVAFIAGGDLWVMDTELREPKRITRTGEEEREPIFSPDGQAIYFVSDAGGQPEIWKATRSGNRPWFLTETFKLEKVTDDGEEKSDLSFSPDGSKFAYVRGRGDLYVASATAKDPKRVIQSWNAPDYDFSPDGKWIVYSQADNDFNYDIWIMPLDGHRPAFNLSRHPYNEGSPRWSPDGKMIAFVAAREKKDTTDVHYVLLRSEDAEKSARDRALQRAMEKFQKSKGPFGTPGNPSPMKSPIGDDDGEQAPSAKDPKEAKEQPKSGLPVAKKDVTVSIDFEGIRERVRRVTIPNSNESNLLWSPDSKKLAFSGTVEGQTGYYTIDVPDGARPSQIASTAGSNGRWLKNGSIVWLSGGLPASMTPGAGGAAAPTAPTLPTGPRGGRTGGAGLGGGAPAATGGYAFRAYQDIDLATKHRAAFDMAWRKMRDNWYDDRLNNRDWNKVRAKYAPMAETRDTETLSTTISLMLGELNGSHLGFIAGASGLPTRGPAGAPDEPSAADRWNTSTMHLGARFDRSFAGPGWKVRDVLPEGPASQKRSKLNPGDIVTSIDGKAVDATTDPTTVLNVGPGHEFRLKVRDAAGMERDVVLRPTTFAAARQLLYTKWIQDNRAAIDKLSDNKLGYLHIAAMDMSSFYKFEEALYDAGAGKDGLVIDVRENGGGSTADHLLTALTQPQHAIAVPRGGGQGYPHDRTVYATWLKPIVVLCNQNSFSNAEIFSHAVKTLKRGHVVGVPTAGGVISTGGTTIMDVGFLRMPFRGWYLVDSGEDMELHGAVPHHVVWPQPGDMATGKDAQIEKAVAVLLDDVKAWKARPQPKLQKASERK